MFMLKTGTSLAMGMIQLSYNKPSFNDDVALWDASYATTMCWMFQSTASFDPHGLLWDASSDATMNVTFRSGYFSADIS